MATIEDSTIAPRRWTSARIKKAMLLPKPETGCRLAARYEAGGLELLERKLLRQIAAKADIIDVGRDAYPVHGEYLPRHWLLVPITQQELGVLANFECDREDLEPDAGAEPDCDDEANGTESEPNVVSPQGAGMLSPIGAALSVRQWRSDQAAAD